MSHPNAATINGMNPRVAYVAAPLLTLAYGLLRIIDGLDGVRGPGAAWTMGHVAFLLALLFWVPVTRDLRRRLNQAPVPTAFSAIAFAGAAALTAQFAVDIVAGLRAADHAAMSAQFQHVQSIPGVTPIVYTVGPSLFYIGLSALVIHLALVRQTKPWTPVLFVTGSILPLLDKDLLPLGALFILAAALLLTSRQVRTHQAPTR